MLLRSDELAAAVVDERARGLLRVYRGILSQLVETENELSLVVGQDVGLTLVDPVGDHAVRLYPVEYREAESRSLTRVV
jgi:hypothetical protein